MAFDLGYLMVVMSELEKVGLMVVKRDVYLAGSLECLVVVTLAEQLAALMVV